MTQWVTLSHLVLDAASPEVSLGASGVLLAVALVWYAYERARDRDQPKPALGGAPDGYESLNPGDDVVSGVEADAARAPSFELLSRTRLASRQLVLHACAVFALPCRME